jgi:small subunit ribosomal protein S4
LNVATSHPVSTVSVPGVRRRANTLSPLVRSKSFVSNTVFSKSNSAVLLQLLETRLDNVVYRAGFGNTRQAARQIVNHGHILVNGRTVDIASFQVKPGDVIKVGGKPSSQQLVTRMTDLTQASPSVDWLDTNKDKLEATVSRIPERSDIDPLVNEQLIVELYSR